VPGRARRRGDPWDAVRVRSARLQFLKAGCPGIGWNVAAYRRARFGPPACSQPAASSISNPVRLGNRKELSGGRYRVCLRLNFEECSVPST
jgi:hypothetical protein